MTYRLLGDRVAVKPEDTKEATESGILLPESGQDVLRYGTVVLVGKGLWSETSNKRIPIDCTVADRIVWHQASGSPLTIDGDAVVILANREVIGVFD